MAISLEQIKSLREKTGVSMQACKKALEEANGDEAKAIEILRKKGEAKAVERSERATGQGIIASYVHTNNKIGVLVQLGCETDFVARNEDFQALGRDIAMHVAAMNPLYLSPADVQPELIEREREIWKAQLAKEGKPEKMWDKIMEGKEKKFREEISLLSQPFVKNPEITIEKLIADAVLKLGENIKIVRFTRYSF
ncbi:elongation factor Ts [Candidatus Peregrinibacteria bacterium]|nr:elongation factor Ts [Candidatus Peregrinibacteria bacterium]